MLFSNTGCTYMMNQIDPALDFAYTCCTSRGGAAGGARARAASDACSNEARVHEHAARARGRTGIRTRPAARPPSCDCWCCWRALLRVALRLLWVDGDPRSKTFGQLPPCAPVHRFKVVLEDGVGLLVVTVTPGEGDGSRWITLKG